MLCMCFKNTEHPRRFCFLRFINPLPEFYLECIILLDIKTSSSYHANNTIRGTNHTRTKERGFIITVKVSTRINGRVTSINIKDTIAALHYLMLSDRSDNAPIDHHVTHHIQDTCHAIITKWNGDTGKGLTGFITDSMILDLLEDKDIARYNKIVKYIGMQP